MLFLPHPKRKQIRASLKQFSEAGDAIEQALRRGDTPPMGMIERLSKVVGSNDPETILRAITDIHDEMELQYHAQLLDLAPTDLTAFAEYLNPEEPPADWHVWLCNKLMEMADPRNDLLRMLISAPPGHAKSTYSTRLFSAWWLGNNPRKRYIQAGHTTAFCENEFGKKVKGIIESERFQDIFPKIQLSTDSKAAGYWALAAASGGGSYLTRGVGQGIAGFRAHCAGIDDPFASREDAESETIRDKVWDWFSADFTTRLLPRSPMFVVATRWHSDDLIGRIEQMNRDGKGLPWYVVNLPAIAIEEGDVLGRQVGEVLWPELFDLDHLLTLKATLPSRDWNSLYMGKPVDEEGGVIQGAWLKRYKKLPPENERRRITVSVDSASKTGERNDFTAIGVWIEDFYQNHFLAHVTREKMEFAALVRRIESVATVWGASAILIEDKGSGTQYIQERSGKAPAPVIPISVNNNSKEFRLDGVSPLFEAGKVWVPEQSDKGWHADYEAELIGFPNAKYDDQVDMTSQYLDWARLRQGRGNKKLGGMGVTRSRDTSKLQSAIEAKIAEAALHALKHDPIARALALARGQELPDPD
jgi:predicted phage terminase large subunit-like protein